MKAATRRLGGFKHEIAIRGHRLLADEKVGGGGTDAGPTPQELLAASLASCIALTLEVYARHKEWDLGKTVVSVEYEGVGEPTHFDVTLRPDGALSAEQVQRLEVIATKCPVHRILASEATFTQHTETAA